jgi:hypothetical protein
MIGMSYKLVSLLFLCFAFGSIHGCNADYSDNTIQDDENHYSRNLLITAPVAALISQRANNNDKAVALKLETEFNNWLNKPAGQEAAQFCSEFKNRPDIYQGCLEDIKVTGNNDIALQGALAEEEFRSKSKMSTSRKFCVASGDPHFTNYDGDYFHLQEKGIFTLMRTSDLEVQEKVRKNGPDKVGVPTCLTGVAIRYNNLITIEIDAENVRKIVVNGQVSVDLPKDFTMKFGGLEVRYGTQNIEWRGTSSKTTGTKIVAPNGFGVMVMGGYCGIVEVNVPEKYFNNVDGICGNADGTRDTNDYKNPDGIVMNVNRGAKNWGMSGYNGPTSPLSKWQLAWKPSGSDCFFQSGCEATPITRTLTSSKKAKAQAPAPAPKAQAPAPAPAPKAQAPAPAPKAQAPAPAPKAQAQAPAPAPKAQASAPAPAPKAQASAPAPAPKAQASAPAPAPKAQASAPAPAPKAQASAPAPKAQASAPEPAPKAQASAPAPTSKAQASVTSASQSPSKKVPEQAPTPKAQASVTSASQSPSKKVPEQATTSKAQSQSKSPSTKVPVEAPTPKAQSQSKSPSTKVPVEAPTPKAQASVTSASQSPSKKVPEQDTTSKAQSQSKSPSTKVPVEAPTPKAQSQSKSPSTKVPDQAPTPAPAAAVKVVVTPTAPTSKASTSGSAAWATSSSASDWSSSVSASSDSKSSSSKSSSLAHTNNTHHINLRTTRHNDLIKNLKLVKTVSNHTTACISSYLYVKYDGRGSIFIAGANKKLKVHINRKDCLGKTEGLQKVVQFNPNDVTYFSIDVESTFEGHLDCGGSAFWNAQKSREFTQKCSWNSFGAKNPTIVTTVTLYTTPTAVEKVEERLRNDLMGQWYLLADRKVDYKLRQCLVATIFRHDSNFFMKHSVNIGKQTFNIKDHPIESFAIDTQLFKMDGQVYSYKISEFTHSKGTTEHILLLKNTKDASDERVFGDKVYSKTAIDKLIKDKYTGLTTIEQKCYTD